MTDKLSSAARNALLQCMGVKDGESVLIVTDSLLKDLGEIFLKEAQDLNTEAMMIEMVPRVSNAEEPPASVSAAMKEADVVLLVTKRSLSHTQARKEANKAGARVASLPGLTADMMARTLGADYTDIGQLGLRIGELLTKGKSAHLTSPAGTDLYINLEGRDGHPDTGMYGEKGIFGNLPAGEAYIAPPEHTTRGMLVIDGSIAGIGKVTEPIHIKVEQGFATEITGGESAQRLIELLDKHGKEARNIAELGIGTNHEAKLTGIVLEDEKVLGTVHVALGDNSTIGGVIHVASHLDGIVLNPTLEIDGQVLLKEGKMVG